MLAMLSHFAHYAKISSLDNQYSENRFPYQRSFLSSPTEQLFQTRIPTQKQRGPELENLSDFLQRRNSAVVLHHDLLRFVGEFVATVEPAEEILEFGALLLRLASETTLHPEFVCVSVLRLMGACIASDPIPEIQRQTVPSASTSIRKSAGGFPQQRRERRLGVLVVRVCRQVNRTAGSKVD